MYIGPNSAGPTSQSAYLRHYKFDNIISAIRVIPPDWKPGWTTDSDGDGLPDEIEALITSSWPQPTTRWGPFDDAKADADEDHLNDWHELLFELNPNDPHTLHEDYDDHHQNITFLENVASDGIYYFTEPNYQGFVTGTHTRTSGRTVSYGTYPLFNNVVSSVKVVGNGSVFLIDNADSIWSFFDTSSYMIISDDTPNLGHMDNRMSSVIIY